MRNCLLAAMATVTLLAGVMGTTSAQSVLDNERRWMGVRNNSKSEAWYINIIPTSKDCCWSRDLLETEILPSGEAMLLNFNVGSKECEFDILVEGRSPDRGWYFRNVNVCREIRLTLEDSTGDGKDRKMTVKNESEITAELVYAIPSGRDCCWSRGDLLGKDPIPPGQSLSVNFDDGRGRCRFDILVRGGPRDGTRVRFVRDWYFKGIDVCRQAELPLKVSSDDGEVRKMTVLNESRFTALYVNAIPSDRDCCWSHDLLGGRRVVRPGQFLPVNFDVGDGKCIFDILVRSGSRSRYWYFGNMNVCRQSELTLKDTAGDGRDRKMMVQNDSGLTAYVVNAIPSDRDCCWSHDLLGKHEIAPGGSLVVDFDDGSGRCNLDIRVRSESSDLEWNVGGVDVCRSDRRKITLK